MPLKLIPCLVGFFPVTANTHRPEIVCMIRPVSGKWFSVINLPSIRLAVSAMIFECQRLTATAAFSASLLENLFQLSVRVHTSSFLLLDCVDRQGTVEHGEINSFRRRFGFAPLFLAPYLRLGYGDPPSAFQGLECLAHLSLRRAGSHTSPINPTSITADNAMNGTSMHEGPALLQPSFGTWTAPNGNPGTSSSQAARQ